MEPSGTEITPTPGDVPKGKHVAPESVSVSSNASSFNEKYSMALGFKKPMLLADTRQILVKNVFDDATTTSKKQVKTIKTKADSKPWPKNQEVVTVQKKTISNRSPAELQKMKEETFPYKEPSWGSLPNATDSYAFDVLKHGAIVGTIALNAKSSYSFGRLPSCDVQIEHPSSSRYHAVVQYCSGETGCELVAGWYLYDLDSTHGTWLNKTKITSRVYHRMRVGHVAKFGGSSRLYILTGPDTDQEEEKPLPSKMSKDLLTLHEKKADLLRLAEIQSRENEERILAETTSCSWGMDFQETTEEQDEAVEYLEEASEEAFIDDPKKALNSYFEREGMDPPEYEFIEAGFGKHHCRVQLPLDDAEGHPIYAKSVMTGKKKEVVVACALEACRLLDRMGELRKSAQESAKRKKRQWEENDFYDSDEDTFLDRTGVIEKKRKERMKKAGKRENETLTYSTIQDKLKILNDEKSEIEKKIGEDDQRNMDTNTEELDALDSYMLSIQSGKMDPVTRRKLKTRLHELKIELAKLQSLANIAKPACI